MKPAVSQLLSDTWFTFSSRVLVETFGEMWMRWSTYKCRHSHSRARTTRQFETFSFPSTQDWFTNISLRAARRDEKRSEVWKMRQMYPPHSHSHLVSCCLDENVNQASGTAFIVHLFDRQWTTEYAVFFPFCLYGV